MSGYVKIFREIDKWGWRHKPNTFSLFMYLLTNTNYVEGHFEGHLIKKGQVVFGRKRVAETLGMTEQNVRTALNHLKSTNEITIKTTAKFSIITITKWEKYQEGNQQTNQQVTSNQPATNHIQEGKKLRREEYKEDSHYEFEDEFSMTPPDEHSPDQELNKKQEGKQDQDQNRDQNRDCDQAIEIYKDELGSILPVPRKLTASRKSKLKRRLAELKTLDAWREYCQRIRGSPFLTGDNDRGWRADIDFILGEENMNKILEGKYDARPVGKQRSSGAKYTSQDALDEVIAEIDQQFGKTETDSHNGSAMLCDDEALWQDTRGIEDFNEGNETGFKPLSASIDQHGILQLEAHTDPSSNNSRDTEAD